MKNAQRFGAFAWVGCVLLAGCSGWQSTLDPHSHEAVSLTRLIAVMVAICTVIWLLVMGVLVRAVQRRRVARDGVGVDPRTERRMTLVVAVAMAATLLTVIALTTLSFFMTRAVEPEQDPDALVVKVRGWQWWWEVRYPDAAPDRTIVTANEIHVPVGRTVRIELAAADVIHSFWVPNLAGKLDMIPGRANALTFKASRPGAYRGQCAEFCGLQHAHMAFLVIAEEPADFERWRSAQTGRGRDA